MGVNVELRQHGPRPRRGRPPTTLLEGVADADDVFVDVLNRVYNKGRTPVSDTIDPHANVVMPAADVGRFLAELPILVAAAASDAERQILADIERLARRCAGMDDHHLHFLGD